MELAVQKLAILSFFVLGLSHIVQPRAWAQFFIDLRQKGKTGSFINALIHFPLGAVVVAFHNVWQGIPTILTVIGYAWVLKSLVYFLVPTYGLRSMSRVSLEKSNGFVVAGVVMLGIGSLLLVSLVSNS